MSRAVNFTALVLVTIAVPALAQSHAGHGAHAASSQDECEAEAARHRAMGHAAAEDSCAPDDPAPLGQVEMDHDDMDHSSIGHGQMDHGSDPDSAPEIPIAPPPAAVGSGPPTAADAIWGAEAMRASRAALARENGGMLTAGLLLDRFEFRAREGDDGYLWDGDAWYGGDINRVWVESEGEGSFADGVGDADIALLYGRAISPWFDLQAGARQDLNGPSRTYLDIGIQGIAPYLFEIEGDLLVSNKGDFTAKVEVELDQRMTQRLVVQPRAEIALAAQDVPELGIGGGINNVEMGLHLRYEIAREFAPYLGIEQEWKLGRGADYARARQQDPSVTNYVLGVRFWF
ncbi:copper resistance protein B [Qipengyuania spongiae]|uniref:Copper resistance protein B n=1 Tax=Qipengyuania spongiae TaxID=2909673 RepID=A0ABY5SXG4_9SPHN|nr:copper resistance protein B [Qipengyuania spongiae]UVI38909.1 copper resistance protein B [Qipengyuania spongiae]